MGPTCRTRILCFVAAPFSESIILQVAELCSASSWHPPDYGKTVLSADLGLGLGVSKAHKHDAFLTVFFKELPVD